MCAIARSGFGRNLAEIQSGAKVIFSEKFGLFSIEPRGDRAAGETTNRFALYDETVMVRGSGKT